MERDFNNMKILKEAKQRIRTAFVSETRLTFFLLYAFENDL